MSSFVDDRGNAVAVEYWRSESEHVNTFRLPVNGEEMEFRSKLVVRAELPDGDTFKAWQCMNFLPYGTMYRTDNEEWMLHANGFMKPEPADHFMQGFHRVFSRGVFAKDDAAFLLGVARQAIWAKNNGASSSLLRQ